MSTPAPALTALRVIGVAAALVVVLGTAFGVATSFARTTADAAFTASGVDRLVVDLDVGDVLVEHTDDRDVSVRLSSEGTWTAPRTERRQEGATLALSARCGHSVGFARCQVTYRVAVPEGVDVDVRVAAGRVAVDDVAGDVVAFVDAGDVELTDLRSSRVEARVEVGRVLTSFEEAPDDVRASTSTGPVDVVLPVAGEPYAVEARTEVGQATVAVATTSSSPRRVSATTSVGPVTVSGR